MIVEGLNVLVVACRSEVFGQPGRNGSFAPLWTSLLPSSTARVMSCDCRLEQRATRGGISDKTGQFH